MTDKESEELERSIDYLENEYRVAAKDFERAERVLDDLDERLCRAYAKLDAADKRTPRLG